MSFNPVIYSVFHEMSFSCFVFRFLFQSCYLCFFSSGRFMEVGMIVVR